ncbi:hypothetical protein [Emticicia fontis]
MNETLSHSTKKETQNEKKFTLMALPFILFCLTLQSCKDESTLQPVEQKKTESLSAINTTESKIDTPAKLVDFLAPDGKKYLVSNSDLVKLKKMKISAAAFKRGIVPHTIAGSLSQIGNNVRLYIGGFWQYMEGFYFCKTYTSSASIIVAAGSFVLFDSATSASIPGKITTDVSFVNTGSTMTQASSLHTFNTYSVVPVYNVAGQSVSQYALPQDLTSNVFSYSIYTP